MADVIPALNEPYITIQDIRDAGIPDTEKNDAEVQASIDHWSAQIDTWTGQWFNAREIEVTVEGRNSNILLLGIPIISISQIRINHHLPDNAGDLYTTFDRFQIFKSRDYPDDRRNPRIKLVSNRYSIYYSYGRAFMRALYTTIDGIFGFIEKDGTTPLPIQRACLKLVLRDLKNPLLTEVTEAGGGLGPKKREKTDMHEIEYFESSQSTISKDRGTVSGDPEIDRILSYYRKPIGVGGSINAVPRIDSGML